MTVVAGWDRAGTSCQAPRQVLPFLPARNGLNAHPRPAGVHGKVNTPLVVTPGRGSCQDYRAGFNLRGY